MDKFGYLWKQGWGLLTKPWARRQFKLSVETRRLEYSTEEDEKRGEVDLTGVVASVIGSTKSIKSKFGSSATPFVVVYPQRQEHKRTRMLLVADTLEDAISWVTIVNAASKSGVASESSRYSMMADYAEEEEDTLDTITESNSKSDRLSKTTAQLTMDRITTFIEGNAVVLLVPLSVLLLPSYIQPMTFILMIYAAIFLGKCNVEIVIRGRQDK